MNKTFRLYGLIFVIFMALLVLLELSKKEVIDWRRNFDVQQKTPFGLFVFDKEINTLLKNEVKKTELSPFDYYRSHTEKPHNIILIQHETDFQSWKIILQQVENGSDALVLSDRILPAVADSLKLFVGTTSFRFENILKLTDQKFASDSLIVDKAATGKGFTSYDDDIQVLGHAELDGRKVNFIKKKIGKGHLYFHTEPLIVTNYYLLQPGNENYVQDVFSYLPDRESIWFRTAPNSAAESRSPLRFILSQPALRYAWWLFLASLVLFVIFNAKRKQRVIPVQEPRRNRSVEFVKSISNLYMQEGDFHDMMAKKAQFFLHRIRLDLLLDTQHLDEKFAETLHLKTGKPLAHINEAIELIQKAQNPYANVTKEDLGKMNKLLDEILR